MIPHCHWSLMGCPASRWLCLSVEMEHAEGLKPWPHQQSKNTGGYKQRAKQESRMENTKAKRVMIAPSIQIWLETKIWKDNSARTITCLDFPNLCQHHLRKKKCKCSDILSRTYVVVRCKCLIRWKETEFFGSGCHKERKLRGGIWGKVEEQRGMWGDGEDIWERYDERL